ncbi:MAG: shikimate kinase [Lachnospiraceae bacterium]|nr:shikimate kinase [Lachnospiraceae bacterium]
MYDKGKNIVLIGFMGSGKTTVGVKLSYRLRRPVIDTDKLIESRQQKKISEIFAEEGEDAFRRMETALLQELAGQAYERIFSVGGGTPVREENRPLLKKCGIVFYLRAQAETIYGRLQGDTTRPLLQCENPLGRIRELLQAREAAYADCADVILDVDGATVEELVDRIEAILRETYGIEWKAEGATE